MHGSSNRLSEETLAQSVVESSRQYELALIRVPSLKTLRNFAGNSRFDSGVVSYPGLSKASLSPVTVCANTIIVKASKILIIITSRIIRKLIQIDFNKSLDF